MSAEKKHGRNRSHSKVTRLPREVFEAVNRLIVEGRTIAAIVEYLDGMARAGKIAPQAKPSKSGVGRYTQGFMARLERIDLVREQARTIVAKAEGDGLVIEEAAVTLVLNEIMKILMPEEGDLSAKTVASVALALAKLQSSSATRERAKIEVRRDLANRAEKTAKDVGDKLKKKGLSADAANEIKNQILGIVT